MQWKCFVGASLLTAALVQPHAGGKPVVAGVVIAAILQWSWYRIGGQG